MGALCFGVDVLVSLWCSTVGGSFPSWQDPQPHGWLTLLAFPCLPVCVCLPLCLDFPLLLLSTPLIRMPRRVYEFKGPSSPRDDEDETLPGQLSPGC